MKLQFLLTGLLGFVNAQPNATDSTTTTPTTNLPTVTAPNAYVPTVSQIPTITTTSGPFNVRIAVLVLGYQLDSPGIKTMTESLNSYGIPYEAFVESNNVFPVLPLEDIGGGRFSTIVFADGYSFALTPALDALLAAYELKYGVRRIGFNMWPYSVPGMALSNDAEAGCCTEPSLEQFLRWDAASLASTKSGLNPAGVLSSIGLYHYPAIITDPLTVKPLLYADPVPGKYAAQSVIGVMTTQLDGRKGMFFFMSAGDWSVTSLVINHAWIGWSMRQLFPGYRRVIFGTQVDDLFLGTEQWDPLTKTNNVSYRVTVQDLNRHTSWMTDLNKRLPAGSKYVIELGYNGNGVLAFLKDPLTLQYDQPTVDNQYFFKKPKDTGNTWWPANYNSAWSKTEMTKDRLFAYFAGTNVNQFFILSHTFSHLDLNNVTKSDVLNEISINQKFASAAYANFDARVSLAYSPKSLITPRITGLLSGDALSAFAELGITSIVGDNSRMLYDPLRRHWPVMTTVAENGYAGMAIIPRYATEVYYNVATEAQNLDEYNFIYASRIGVTTDYLTVLKRESSRVVRAMLLMHHDAHMFHQVNMRVADLDTETIANGQRGKFSLLMKWVEFMTTAFTQLVQWPIITVKQDVLHQLFQERMGRDQCNYQLYATVNNNTVSMARLTTSSACKVPVTVPYRVSTASEVGKIREQLSAIDLTTYWIRSTGQSETLFNWVSGFVWN